MSAASVIQACERFVTGLALGEPATSDLAKVLQRADLAILQLMYELSLEAELTHEVACIRGVPILIQHCAIHLADDLADGDCDYFRHPASQGTTALYTLQQLFSLSLHQCQLDTPTLNNILILLTRTGTAQHQEIAIKNWTLEHSIEAAKGLNGCQFEAYFSIASANTVHHRRFSELGYHYGIVNHLANDIMSNDARYLQLNMCERAVLRRWGLEQAQEISEAGFSSLTSRLPSLLRHLR